MIETDLARIASALETLADAYCRQVDTTARFLGEQPEPLLKTEVPQSPEEFVKPKAGPGRGHKKPKPEPVEENPTQADATAPAAEVPGTVQETDTSLASPSDFSKAEKAIDEKLVDMGLDPNNFKVSPAAEALSKVPEVTLEDVSRAVVEMAKVKTRDEIMAVWQPFGIKRGSDLRPEQYFDALMALKEAMRA